MSELDEGGQLFLQVPSPSRRVDAVAGLDPFWTDLPRAFQATWPGLRHRLVVSPPLDVAPPTPGDLHLLGFRPSRDRVLAFVPAIDDEIRPLRDMQPHVTRMMRPTVSKPDRGREALTWSFANAFQAHAWDVPARPSGVTAPEWVGGDDDGTQHYRLSSDMPAAFVAPSIQASERRKLLSMTVSGRLVRPADASATGGHVILQSSEGERIGAFSFQLGSEAGDVTVSFESLEKDLLEMRAPPTLLLIPCRMGGVVGLRSVTITTGH